MQTIYTIDASVYVSAFSPDEVAHGASMRFLEQVASAGIPVIVPLLLLPEVGGTAARKNGDSRAAIRLVDTIVGLPGHRFVPLSRAIADLAVDVAAGSKLRGSDAVYAAVALRYATTLVTLDHQQRERVADLVTTLTPQQAT